MSPAPAFKVAIPKRTAADSIHSVFTHKGEHLFINQSLEDAFPSVDPGLRPFGDTVLLQLRSPAKKTASGLIIPDETQETEMWNTQIGKVIALGPLAFCNRTTRTPWPEGAWVTVGDYVRIAKYEPRRWAVEYGPANARQSALFVFVKDLLLEGGVTGDPRTIKSFL